MLYCDDFSGWSRSVVCSGWDFAGGERLLLFSYVLHRAEIICSCCAEQILFTRCLINRLTDFVHEVQVDCTRYSICAADSCTFHLVCFTVVVQTCACRWISGITSRRTTVFRQFHSRPRQAYQSHPIPVSSWLLRGYPIWVMASAALDTKSKAGFAFMTLVRSERCLLCVSIDTFTLETPMSVSRDTIGRLVIWWCSCVLLCLRTSYECMHFSDVNYLCSNFA